MKTRYIFLLLLLFLPTLYSFKIDGTTCYCDSCNDCTSALNGLTCNKVFLLSNITSEDNTCILINKDINSKFFSCNGFSLTASTKNSTGIVVLGEHNNIQFCNLNGFLLGISSVASYNSFNNINLDNCKTSFSISVGRFNEFDEINISNSDLGFMLISSDSSEIRNTILTHLKKGIYLISSNRVLIKNLTLNNSLTGIYSSDNSMYLNIKDSTFYRNGDAIILSSDSPIISNSSFKENNLSILVNSANGVIKNSSFFNNKLSLYFNNAVNYNIFNNLFKGSKIFKLKNTFKGYVYNNIINSTSPFIFEDISRLFWNTSFSHKRNILGLSSFGGNYWIDAEKKGYSETCSDRNNDAICDKPYKINKNNIDFLPLTVPSDRSPPYITFSPPTPEDSSILFSNNLTVNVTAYDESGISLILLHVSNLEKQEHSYSCINNNTCFYSFSDISEGAYFINATAFDKHKNVNHTKTLLVYVRNSPDSFSYSFIMDYLPVAVVAGLMAVIIKLILDISVMFLKKVIK